MNCLFPKEVNVCLNGRLTKILVPCRKCIRCLNQRIHDWEYRCSKELLYSKFGAFISLTYADEFLPPNGVEVSELQKFIKRLRKHGVQFSYYALGEYGTSEEHTHRAHYHVLLFVKSDHNFRDIRELVSKSWNFGRIDVLEMTKGRIHYTISYLSTLFKPEGKNKPFAVMSKRPALGSQVLEDPQFVKQLRQSDLNYAFRNGRKVHLPRYYRNKLKDDEPFTQIDYYTKCKCQLCKQDYEKKLEYSKHHNVVHDFFRPGLQTVDQISALEDKTLKSLLFDYYMYRYRDSSNTDFVLKQRNKKTKIIKK